MEELHLNVALLRARVPNLSIAARTIGLRPATVSNLCTGKIPIGRAEVLTLAKLAILARCTMDELIIAGSPLGMIETGIKVLDVLAPIVKGGTTGLVAGPHSGQLVLLAELMLRMKRCGFATIFWKPSEDGLGVDDVVQHAEVTCDTQENVYEHIIKMAKTKDILLGADRSIVVSGGLQELQDKLKNAGVGAVTILLVDTGCASVDEDLPYGPLDTFLKFDAELTTRGLYPAIDPVSSASVILEGAQLGAPHLAIQQRARKLIRRYREIRPLAVHGRVNRLSEAQLQDFNRGERLEAYMSQPFFIAEPFTHKSGEWVTLQRALEDVATILDGGADQFSVQSLTFGGQIP